MKLVPAILVLGLLALAGCTTTTTTVSTVPGIGAPPAEFSRHAQPGS